MFKRLKNLRNKVQHQIERIQRNAKMASNVMLLAKDTGLGNNRLVKPILDFIKTSDVEFLNRVQEGLREGPPDVTHIYAQDQNGLIGVNNQDGLHGKMPWDSKDDMRHFVKNTKGKVVIVGGTTFRGFGNYVLKNRTVIIVSRETNTATRIRNLPDHYVVKSIEEAYSLARIRIIKDNLPNEIMILGGASIYKQTLHLVTKVLVSNIKVEAVGNVYCDWTYPANVNIKNFYFTGALSNV